MGSNPTAVGQQAALHRSTGARRAPAPCPLEQSGRSSAGPKGISLPSRCLQPPRRGDSMANGRAALLPARALNHTAPKPPWGCAPAASHPGQDPAQDQSKSAARERDPHRHHGPNAWKTPSRHPGAKPSPETHCNKITHPGLEARVPTWRAGPKIHPVTLPGQQAMQHGASRRASPRRACSPRSGATPQASVCFPRTHIHTDTQTYSRKPAVRNHAGEAITQAPKPPQPLSSHARKDICSWFHLESSHAETVAAAA